MTSQKNFYDASKDGFYGENQEFGGRYVPEILLPALEELTETFLKFRNDPNFLNEYYYHSQHLTGRPSPLIYASNLTKKLAGAKIYLKNEGNNFTGSHKINHCLFHALLAKKMGKKRVICETGAGQHGLATATVCAKFGLDCVIFMGQKSIEKQYPNVFWMKQLGAKIIAVKNGSQGLTEAAEAAMADWIENPDSYFMLGSAVGPHPYPEIVRHAQKIIGKEVKQQLKQLENRDYPDRIIACIGGGSNAIGIFQEFLDDKRVELWGVEAGGNGVEKAFSHASRFHSNRAKIGIFEGFKSLFLMNELGQIDPTSSISAGLDYSGIGPIHAFLEKVGRLKTSYATDQEVVHAFQLLAKMEGILAALESSHAIAEAIKQAPNLATDKIIIVNLSGRADNYIFNIAKAVGDEDFQKFCNNFQLNPKES